MDATLEALTAELTDPIARITGKMPVGFSVIPNAGGYTQALRRLVHFADGTRAFVKAATSDNTREWIDKERVFYQALSGASFLPHFFGAGQIGEGKTAHPFLLLEDLSACFWPRVEESGEASPWTTARVDAVLDALGLIRSQTACAPANLPRVENERADFESWHLVAQTPTPFLSLGLCTEAWLNRALPTLIAAENAAAITASGTRVDPLIGSDLLHLDVRSDNICFRPDGRAVLVDWNWASVGNGALDIAGWLPSLHFEGGPRPEAVSQEAGAFAALLAGFWAYRAGLPAPIGAPRVRVVQKQQLTTALPWAARTLGLPPP